MPATDTESTRRMPWRLAVLIPAAVFIVIWRGIPGITPKLTFTWVIALLGGVGLVVVGIWGPRFLAAAGRAQKEASARRRIKAQKAAAKAQLKAAKAAAKK